MIKAGQSLFRDSIYALSTGSLPAGVAVIRLSGQHVQPALECIAAGVPTPRTASLRRITGRTGDVLDKGLVLFFPSPHSFTGEDCAEFHLHGGKAVVAAVMETLGGISGFRQAEAGEFTRRAFLNGKMDLTSAEALADLIAAETEAQRRLAVENADGRQGRLYDGWRRRLLHARAMIEAELDFSDEGDVPGSVSNEVWTDLAHLSDEMGEHLSGQQAARIVRDGFRVVVAGAPNAGKSSLVNALAKRDVAIVTEVPGTTRDVIETILDLGGYKVILSDTAGLRGSDELVELIGIDRARSAVRSADLVLHLVAPGGVPDDTIAAAAATLLLVATKLDLAAISVGNDRYDHAISTVSGEGVDVLLNDIERLAGVAAGVQGVVLPTRLRQIQLLEVGMMHLCDAISSTSGEELRAEDLRLAANALGRVIGANDVEDVLSEVFSRFCIGK